MRAGPGLVPDGDRVGRAGTQQLPGDRYPAHLEIGELGESLLAEVELPGAQGRGHSLVIRTVIDLPPAARTSTYAPHAPAVSPRAADSTDRSASPLRYSHKNENGNHTGRCEPNFAASAAERGPPSRRSRHHEAQQTRLSPPSARRPRWKDHRRTATRRRRCGSPPGRPVRPLPDRAPAGGPRRERRHGRTSECARQRAVHFRRPAAPGLAALGKRCPSRRSSTRARSTRSARLAAEEFHRCVGDVQQHVFKRLSGRGHGRASRTAHCGPESGF